MREALVVANEQRRYGGADAKAQHRDQGKGRKGDQLSRCILLAAGMRGTHAKPGM